MSSFQGGLGGADGGGGGGGGGVSGATRCFIYLQPIPELTSLCDIRIVF